MSEIIVRKLDKGDISAVRQLCLDTGYKGKPLSAVDYFDDGVLFTLLFCDDFILFEADNCFVALRSGAVVGYILGALDIRRWERKFILRMVPRIILRLVSKTWHSYPSSLWTVIFFVRHFAKNPLSRKQMIQYPATLHMNVAPGQQGGGIGRKLLTEYEKHLQNCGITGVQLQTSTENEAAVAFYLKQGFNLACRLSGPIWPDGSDAEHLFFVKSLH